MKTSLLMHLAAVLAAVGLPACGSSFAGSCTFDDPTPGYTFCQDFTGSGYTTTVVQKDCASGNGTYSPSACPTTGVIGTCEFFAGTAGAGRISYYATDGGTSQSSAEASCTSTGGTWTAG